MGLKSADQALAATHWTAFAALSASPFPASPDAFASLYTPASLQASELR